ncbi:MAG: RNA polymerase sigma factor [Collinsella stercoris]|uniref:RNA polymerase sigma factor n=1 Tax=Collinsella stercoris TaxID=147206 RepID=UPI00399342F8
MGAWSASAARRAGETLERPPQTAGEPTSRLIEAEANRLVETYADTILRVSYTYLHSTQDAEDICQDVLLKALNRAERFESAEHERAWIIRVTINAAKDLLRRQSGRATVALDDIAEPVAPTRATERELAARAEGILEHVMALPLEYREAIYLHYYEGYSIKQIAAIVHASESAVATRLSRGRSKLRPALEGVRHEFDL